MILAVASCSALACCGCDAATKKAYHEEIARHVYTNELGLVVVASIVWASAPVGGPSALHALCTDRAWGVVFASAGSEQDAGFVPSMFEVPAPNRPVKITTLSRTRIVATVNGEVWQTEQNVTGDR